MARKQAPAPKAITSAPLRPRFRLFRGLVGLVVFSVGAWFVGDEISFAVRARSFAGVVLHPLKGGKVQVQYEVPGRGIYHTPVDAVWLSRFDTLDPVTILYQPGPPEQVRLGGFLQRYSFPLSALVLGLLLGGREWWRWLRHLLDKRATREGHARG